MATVANNVLTNGLRGRLGDALVFKTMRGKTFVATPARKPGKRKETTAQRSTRANFRAATEWAQHILLDPVKKAYYSKRAKALQLPNAYTAALTDYMRKPMLKTQLGYDRTTVFAVSKKDFQLKKVAVVIRKDQEEEVRPITSNNGKWIFKLATEEVNETSYVRVTDEVGREMRMMLIKV